MDFSLPRPRENLGSSRIEFLNVFKKSCIRTILQMLQQSGSGHIGGSLSILDILAVLYAFRISKTNERVIFSNGHISPVVYSILSELGVLDREEVIKTFRQDGSPFEGHVSRDVPGVFYGTGPLGMGLSVACGIALSEKKQQINRRVFVTLGDGECQEGQIHEAILFATKYKLGNLTALVDFNRVQLSGAVADIMPINILEMFRTGGWEAIEIDGHDSEKIWEVLSSSYEKPFAIIARTFMGKGIPEFEKEGRQFKSTWHGKVPSREKIEEFLPHFSLDIEEENLLGSFRESISFVPEMEVDIPFLQKLPLTSGNNILYLPTETVDCRTAYGNALLDLAKSNAEIVGGSADLGSSTMTKIMTDELPKQALEFGIMEQNMVSVCGGLSLSGLVPFCSTFGVFMTGHAKAQARLNDLNKTNVKMVATHCGLSVGEDGPTHQAIDDLGSFSGFFHTALCEPADANHCDRIIRYSATHYGNFYIRMGRNKLPILTKLDGSPFYDEKYEYRYGKCDLLREGGGVTVVSAGECVKEALLAWEESEKKFDLLVVSSPKIFDETLRHSLEKTKRVIVVEDHIGRSGYAGGISFFTETNNIAVEYFKSLSVEGYQLSGKTKDLYDTAKINKDSILQTLLQLEF